MSRPIKHEAVKAWIEEMTLPTYPDLGPDPNPMFFEYRNIQGAKGNIYPSPFTDQLSSEKVDRTYQGVFLENEYIQVILLPEIGGRIFAAMDKTNGYDFFYRHKVIKPALIGLFGPWISGGVEFNWPQHHRPSTFMPVDFTVEAHADGSKTVWMSEHDPLNRTKGMVGVCLYPGKATVETKVRLFNRTSSPQTFLWWENAGVHINEHYQVIFPPDVHYAVFHTKAIVIEYPIAKGVFNNAIDYGDGTDVSWYVNSPAPTSFFAGDSKYEFFGGYDHEHKAGVVHVANRFISPGKKFFTWGNGPFGHRWQKNLMDDEGEYLELMAGVYTDNQPDFSWIMPYETKSFSQYWYPIQEIGPMKNANTRAALNLEVRGKTIQVGVYATEEMVNARIVLVSAEKILLDETVNLKPGKAFKGNIPVVGVINETDLLLKLLTNDGNEVIHYVPEGVWDGKLPETFKPPAAPQEVESNENLYLIGLHLEQYRHPFLSPVVYWEEALRRDPGDARCHIAMGRLAFRQGNYAKAEDHFRMAVKRLTSLNLHPYDGEAHYFLGLILQQEDKTDEAYSMLYKATWSSSWRSAAFYRLALIETVRKNYSLALEFLNKSLQTNNENCKARGIKSAIFRHLGLLDEAEILANETISLDPLDTFARHELVLIARAQGKPRVTQQRLDELHEMLRGEVQTYLDVAFDYASAGLYEDTFPLLGYMANVPNLNPMVGYTMGCFAHHLSDEIVSQDWCKKAAKASPDFCFPWRLEEMDILKEVLKNNPKDARAHYYLGNLLYDKKQYKEAVEHWQISSQLEPGFSIPWRNLGLASYNLDHDLDKALEYLSKACAVNPQDPRLLLEYDQLCYRKAYSPADRLVNFEKSPLVVAKRDDLVSQQIMLYNCTGQPEKALELASKRSFHPWEGGEGSVSEHYANAHWLLGRRALDQGDAQTALKHFQAGLEFPDNLGEIPREAGVIHLIYESGLANEALGKSAEAVATFEKVAAFKGDLSLVSYYQALALIHVGKELEGINKLEQLLKKATELAANPPGSNFFFYGNPSPVFEDDPQKLQHIYFLFLAGMARAGLGDRIGARSALAQVLAVDQTRLIAHEEFIRL